MSETDANAIAQAIIDFVKEDVLYDQDDVALDENTQLLAEGLLDSMGVLRVIDFIEQRYGVSIQPSEIRLDDFKDVSTVCALIQSRGAS